MKIKFNYGDKITYEYEVIF